MFRMLAKCFTMLRYVACFDVEAFELPHQLQLKLTFRKVSLSIPNSPSSFVTMVNFPPIPFPFFFDRSRVREFAHCLHVLGFFIVTP